MPTIPCPSCNEQVSNKAFDCPKCGHPIRKPKRGIFGKISIWTFYLFNAFMLWWLIAGTGEATKGMDALQGAELAGAQIGTGIGVMMILVLWVIGSVILGLIALLTRPRKA